MVTYCCVYQCSNNGGSKTAKLSFHEFPNKDKFPQLHRQWLHKINRKSFIPTKRTSVCSAHFLEDDFELRSRLKRQLMGDAAGRSVAILKKSAVPTLLLTGASKSNVPSPPKKRERSMFLRNKAMTELLDHIPEDLSMQIASTSKSKPKKCAKPVAAASTSQAPSGNRKRKNVQDHDADDASMCIQFSREISTQCELGVETLRSTSHEEQERNETDSSDSEPEPHDFDESFRLNSHDEDSETTDSETESTATDDERERGSDASNVFLIFWNSLSLLFAVCHICGGPVGEMIKKCRGSMVTIKTICSVGHNYTWMSQPKRRNIALGAINIVAALYTCGLSFTAFKSFAIALKLHIMTTSTYYRIVKTYVKPAIVNTWESQREIELYDLSLTGKDIWLSGDGQYDSPGYCGKFVTYSVMDVRTNRIVDFKVMQRKQTAGDLEKAACTALMKDLSSVLDIKLFISDRHRGIALLMRTEHPSIRHEFDVWHMAKSLRKRLAGVNNSPLISLWQPSIQNHLWWSSQTCGGNDDMLVERFTSALNHMSNKHKWTGNKLFHGCEHAELTAKEVADTKWVKRNSPDHITLNKIINNPTFLKDLRHTSNYCHTGKKTYKK
jgi:hypothetical protein